MPYGFVLNGAAYSTFQIAGMTNVFPIGINNRQQVTIQSVDAAGQWHAYLKRGSRLTELAYPAASVTYAERINNQGQLVGSYLDAAGTLHGFVYDTGTATYTTVDDPGTVGTALDGINDAQTLVGRYQASVGGLEQGLKAIGSLP